MTQPQHKDSSRPINPDDAGITPDQKILAAVNNGFKGAPAPVGVLAKLFRKIVDDLGIRAFIWAQLMDNYLNNPANGIAQNSKDRSTARGNLNKELYRERMSWKVFLKAIRFFGVLRADFTVKLYHSETHITEHTVVMYERVPKRRNPDLYKLPEDHHGLDRPILDTDEE